MDIKKKIKDFNKRWKIQENINFEEEFFKFKIRVINILKYIDSCVTEKGISLFCNVLGIREIWKSSLYGYDEYSSNIIDSLEKENNPVEFYRLLELIFCLPFKSLNTKETLANNLAEVIDFSDINLAISIKDGGEIILYPAGERELDQKLVDEVLTFLNEESQKHFIEALKYYKNRSYVKSAESLRRALEEFLRFKFKNKKGLKKNIEEMRVILKVNNRDPLIRNIIFQVFSYLDQYFNENSKHKDGDIDKPESEYLIYQTGTLMRFIEKTIK